MIDSDSDEEESMLFELLLEEEDEIRQEEDEIIFQAVIGAAFICYGVAESQRIRAER